jgi:hypothetical protein
MVRKARKPSVAVYAGAQIVCDPDVMPCSEQSIGKVSAHKAIATGEKSSIRISFLLQKRANYTPTSFCQEQSILPRQYYTVCDSPVARLSSPLLQTSQQHRFSSQLGNASRRQRKSADTGFWEDFQIYYG